MPGQTLKYMNFEPQDLCVNTAQKTSKEPMCPGQNILQTRDDR